MAAPLKRLSLSEVPHHSDLPDGRALLAEAEAYRVLETGPLKHFGGLVMPVKLALTRRKGVATYHFDLEVTPVHDADGKATTIEINNLSHIVPAKLSELKIGKHVVKPAGEGVVKAAMESEGEDIELVVFEVKTKADDPVLNMIGRGGAGDVVLGFSDVDEAKGWYLYLSAVLGVANEEDTESFEAMKAKSIGGHQAGALGKLFAAAAK